MVELISGLLQKTGLGDFTLFTARVICSVVALIVCVAVRSLIKHVLARCMIRITERKKVPWLEVVVKNKLFTRVPNLAIPVIASAFSSDIAGNNALFTKALDISVIIIVLSVLDSCIKSVGMIYGFHEVSKTFPIRGLLQVVSIAVYIIGGIIIVSILADKSPAALLGSIGAMTAITSIVFKDAILGFISGIQLTGNDMIRIGDWIELPKHSANGTVIDLTMTTVKVENFDKTITLIPAYTLVSEAFINWRGMVNTGARRIKRSIAIDATGVCICDEEMINRLKNIDWLKEYMKNNWPDNGPESINGGCMTNIGIFRAYITEYIKQHPHIRKDLPMIVRQMEPGERGIPLEVYAFADTTIWAEYESIQSDIFDYLYAIISEFGLTLYQNPSSNDIHRISSFQG